ncbi:MAG: hypothetical protein J4N36_01150 [Chloroflexi bacterium]|nr:hypothetical protein [Chloroflexota bacterium]MCI0817184.1 hypothetical protein [Chloroflexota bacterium]MCI0838167.1 hypothetical protein [Chloroflexota bacterium]MCI0842346.1 hypothetical protein [Chloroflexota bacterium]MCI0884866.1 hypothetical protein [Chloroflexota bacterium]
MIPDHYWRILRNWYWLIGGIALACALIAAVMLPALLNGGGSGHSSSVTLGVTRMVSFSGTTAAGEGDSEAMASYTTSIAERGSSPQFLSTLKDTLAEEGVTLKVDPSFTANEGLFRVTIEATANVPNDARVIAETAAELLIADTTAEEGRIALSLTSTSDQQETELLARLTAVYADRLDRLFELGESDVREALSGLVSRGVSASLSADYVRLVEDLARLSGDPQLTVLNTEAEALESQLAEISAARRDFSTELLQGGPVSIVTPAETVPFAPATTLKARDAAVMGLLVGLVLGWIGGNMLESMQLNLRMKKHREEEWDTSLSSAGSLFSDD